MQIVSMLAAPCKCSVDPQTLPCPLAERCVDDNENEQRHTARFDKLGAFKIFGAESFASLSKRGERIQEQSRYARPAKLLMDNMSRVYHLKTRFNN
jgi:hypothetical protein